MSKVEEKWFGNMSKRNILLKNVSSFNVGAVLTYDLQLSSNLSDISSNYIGIVEDSKRIVLNGYISFNATNWSTITSETIIAGDTLYLSSNGSLTKTMPTNGIIKKVVQVISATEGIVFAFNETNTTKIITFSSTDLINDEIVITNVNPGGCVIRKANGEEILPDENVYNFSNRTLTLNFESFEVGTNWKIIIF